MGLLDLGGLLGGDFFTSKTSNKSSNISKSSLPQATPLQAQSEQGLLQLLAGYNPSGMNQLAGTTTNLMQNLLNSGLNATPGQKSLLEGQTANYMEGLKQQLAEWQKSALSQAQGSALQRGIPLSDIARGMESNVYGRGQQMLAQGYNQAKGMELQNLLQYPLQNLQTMAGLQQNMNNPLFSLLSALGMSRIQGPRDITSTGKGTQTLTPSLFESMMGPAKAIAGGLPAGGF